MSALARGLGIAAAIVALVEAYLFFRGIPPWYAGVLESAPPVVAVLLFYVPGPAAGVAAFAAWTRLDDRGRREHRWVVGAAVAAMFMPMVVPLLVLLAAFIGVLTGR